MGEAEVRWGYDLGDFAGAVDPAPGKYNPEAGDEYDNWWRIRYRTNGRRFSRNFFGLKADAEHLLKKLHVEPTDTLRVHVHLSCFMSMTQVRSRVAQGLWKLADEINQEAVGLGGKGRDRRGRRFALDVVIHHQIQRAEVEVAATQKIVNDLKRKIR